MDTKNGDIYNANFENVLANQINLLQRSTRELIHKDLENKEKICKTLIMLKKKIKENIDDLSAIASKINTNVAIYELFKEHLNHIHYLQEVGKYVFLFLNQLKVQNVEIYSATIMQDMDELTKLLNMSMEKCLLIFEDMNSLENVSKELETLRNNKKWCSDVFEKLPVLVNHLKALKISRQTVE